MANYNFNLTYRAGKLNADADSLSRIPQVFPDVIKAICTAVAADIPLVECISTGNLPSSAEEVEIQENLSFDWEEEQAKDKSICRVVQLMQLDSRPREERLRHESPVVQKILREWKRLKLEQNVLYRMSSNNGESVKQLVLPVSFHEIALKGIHDEVGHPGKEKSLWLARQRFYWPGLEKDVNNRIEHCPRCIRRKSPIKLAELVPIHTSKPMEIVCIDFLSLEQSKGGYENILVITDHFTRYTQTIPCTDCTDNRKSSVR